MESLQQQVSEHFNEGEGEESPSRPVKGNSKSVSESIVIATHKALKEKKEEQAAPLSLISKVTMQQ